METGERLQMTVERLRSGLLSFSGRRYYRVVGSYIESEEFVRVELELVPRYGSYRLDHEGSDHYKQWLSDTGRYDPFAGKSETNPVTKYLSIVNEIDSSTIIYKVVLVAIPHKKRMILEIGKKAEFVEIHESN